MRHIFIYLIRQKNVKAKYLHRIQNIAFITSDLQFYNNYTKFCLIFWIPMKQKPKNVEKLKDKSCLPTI